MTGDEDDADEGHVDGREGGRTEGTEEGREGGKVGEGDPPL